MRKIFALIFILIATNSIAAEKSAAPEEFSFTIGNGLEGFKTLSINNGNLEYKNDDRNKKKVDIKTITISQGKWAEFRNMLDKANLWKWQPKYQNSKLVFDGTIWHIQIKYTDRTLTSEGSNAYPLADGSSNDSAVSSEAFKILLKALSDLSSEKIY